MNANNNFTVFHLIAATVALVAWAEFLSRLANVG